MQLHVTGINDYDSFIDLPTEFDNALNEKGYEQYIYEKLSIKLHTSQSLWL